MFNESCCDLEIEMELVGSIWELTVVITSLIRNMYTKADL